MCKPKAPRLPDMPPPRALARMPMRIDAMNRAEAQMGASRRTRQFRGGVTPRAMTAVLGGTNASSAGGVVLGG